MATQVEAVIVWWCWTSLVEHLVPCGALLTYEERAGGRRWLVLGACDSSGVAGWAVARSPARVQRSVLRIRVLRTDGRAVIFAAASRQGATAEVDVGLGGGAGRVVLAVVTAVDGHGSGFVGDSNPHPRRALGMTDCWHAAKIVVRTVPALMTRRSMLARFE